MDLIVPHSWLKEFLKTKAEPAKIAKCLTLSGVSVEKLEKKNNDYLYYIEITTNRPDSFSIFGIAKECYAVLPQFQISAKLKAYEFSNISIVPQTSKLKPLKVIIKNKSLASRFTAVVCSQIEIVNSPKWLKDRLQSVGIRPINNVVDISNYLMYELGQPLHIFDYDKIRNQQMIVRESRANEEIITLDNVKRVLAKGAIVIEDKNRLIDLCGIMGAKNSEVDLHTKNIVIFVQTYNPVKIRKTCQALSFRTEASLRFEKGLDSEMVMPTMLKAAALIEKLAHGQVASEVIDIYPQKYKTKIVKLDIEKLNSILDIDISKKEIVKILKRLGFETSITKNELICSVPSFRANDINIEEDLIEEVARIYGYYNLPSKLPPNSPPAVREDKILEISKKIKQTLCMFEYLEVYSYSMISKKLADIFKFKSDLIEIKNPLNEELKIMRPTLLTSLLQIYQKNEFEFPRIKIFELANTYKSKGSKLPDHNLTLSIVNNTSNFYQFKGEIEAVFETLNLPQISYSKGQNPMFDLKKSAQINIAGKVVGTIGYLNLEIAHAFELKKIALFAEINITEVIGLAGKPKIYKSVKKTRTASEDLSIIVNKDIIFGDVENVIRKITGKSLLGLELVDDYFDPKFGQNKKSITLRLFLKLSEKDNLVKLRKKLIIELENKLEAKVRTV